MDSLPIAGVSQPEILQVDSHLRLRKFDDQYDFALGWYQDEELVYLVDGHRSTYDFDQLSRMYHYLEQKGELYFIEALEHGSFVPIGDVTFWQEDMPIVIGEKDYRGKGVGRKVVAALVNRGRELGYSCLYVDEIYHDNIGSRRCFASVGFREYEHNDKGVRLKLELKEGA